MRLRVVGFQPEALLEVKARFGDSSSRGQQAGQIGVSLREARLNANGLAELLFGRLRVTALHEQRAESAVQIGVFGIGFDSLLLSAAPRR